MIYSEKSNPRIRNAYKTKTEGISSDRNRKQETKAKTSENKENVGIGSIIDGGGGGLSGLDRTFSASLRD